MNKRQRKKQEKKFSLPRLYSSHFAGNRTFSFRATLERGPGWDDFMARLGELNKGGTAGGGTQSPVHDGRGNHHGAYEEEAARRRAAGWPRMEGISKMRKQSVAARFKDVPLSEIPKGCFAPHNRIQEGMEANYSALWDRLWRGKRVRVSVEPEEICKSVECRGPFYLVLGKKGGIVCHHMIEILVKQK